MSLISKEQYLKIISFIFLWTCLFTPHIEADEVSQTSAPEKASKNSTKKIPKVYTLSKESQENLLREMILVKGGSFKMGSNLTEARKREKPAHTVELDSFYIAKTELSQAIFEELMGWNYSYFAAKNNPVNNISFMNITLFITRLNKATGKKFRLPTEAEWEYAAKGGVKSKGYRFSGSNNIDDVAWYAGNSKRKIHAVALKKPNELGLYDMTGNLWELCQDDMSRTVYTTATRKNPLYLRSDNPKLKTMKVIRGSGYEFGPNESEIYKRDGATNNVRMPDIGFRLAMSKE